MNIFLISTLIGSLGGAFCAAAFNKPRFSEILLVAGIGAVLGASAGLVFQGLISGVH